MVVFLDGLVGLEDGFDQVIDLGAGSNAGEVGAYLPARAGDGMAFLADLVLAAIDGLAARWVALGGHVGNPLAQFLGVQVRWATLYAARFGQCLDQRAGIFASPAHDPNADFGHVGG